MENVLLGGELQTNANIWNLEYIVCFCILNFTSTNLLDLICVQAVCPAYQLDFFHKVEFCALTDFPEKSKSFEKQTKFYPITMWLHGSELNFIKVSYPSLMKIKHFLSFHIKFTLSCFHFVFLSLSSTVVC